MVLREYRSACAYSELPQSNLKQLKEKTSSCRMKKQPIKKPHTPHPPTQKTTKIYVLVTIQHLWGGVSVS